MRYRQRRGVSLLTLLLFLVFELFYFPAQHGFAQNFITEVRPALSGFHLEIPKEMGRVELTQTGIGPSLVHLQMAHGNYEAEQNARKILHHLKNEYGFKTVFLEGTAFKLEPDRLKLFKKNKKVTFQILDQLMKRSFVKGAEIFLLEEKDARGQGIEDLNSYVKNVEAFYDVLEQTQASASFTLQLDEQIERLKSAYLSNELRSIIKQRERYDQKEYDFLSWCEYLKKKAFEKLNLNLDDVAYQMDWPMLLRLFKLKSLEAEFQVGAYESQREIFLKEIKVIPKDLFLRVKKLLYTNVSQDHLPNPQTVRTFEDMIQRLPPSFDYDRFPEVKSFITHLNLQSELEASKLQDELERLFSKIASSMIESPKQQQIFELYQFHRLLTHLFDLQLTPEEYEKIIIQKENFRPQTLLKKIESIDEEKRTEILSFKGVSEIDELYDRSLDFYAWAKERDSQMIRNIEEKMGNDNIEKAIVITGGFHAEPFAKHFSERYYNYALISPEMQSLDGYDHYVDSIMQTLSPRQRNRQSATLESIPFGSHSAEQITQLGFDPQKIALIFLNEAYQFLGSIEPSLSPEKFNALTRQGGTFEDFKLTLVKDKKGQDAFQITFPDGREKMVGQKRQLIVKETVGFDLTSQKESFSGVSNQTIGTYLMPQTSQTSPSDSAPIQSRAELREEDPDALSLSTKSARSELRIMSAFEVKLSNDNVQKVAEELLRSKNVSIELAKREILAMEFQEYDQVNVDRIPRNDALDFNNGKRIRIDLRNEEGEGVGYLRMKMDRNNQVALIDFGFSEFEEQGIVKASDNRYAAISVTEKYREQFAGIGRSLMRVGMEIAKLQGAREFRVERVSRSARGFYESSGGEIYSYDEFLIPENGFREWLPARGYRWDLTSTLPEAGISDRNDYANGMNRVSADERRSELRTTGNIPLKLEPSDLQDIVDELVRKGDVVVQHRYTKKYKMDFKYQDQVTNPSAPRSDDLNFADGPRFRMRLREMTGATIAYVDVKLDRNKKYALLDQGFSPVLLNYHNYREKELDDGLGPALDVEEDFSKANRGTEKTMLRFAMEMAKRIGAEKLFVEQATAETTGDFYEQMGAMKEKHNVSYRDSNGQPSWKEDTRYVWDLNRLDLPSVGINPVGNVIIFKETSATKGATDLVSLGEELASLIIDGKPVPEELLNNIRAQMPNGFVYGVKRILFLASKSRRRTLAQELLRFAEAMDPETLNPEMAYQSYVKIENLRTSFTGSNEMVVNLFMAISEGLLWSVARKIENNEKVKIGCACTANQYRSVALEMLLRQYSKDKSNVELWSAGTFVSRIKKSVGKSAKKTPQSVLRAAEKFGIEQEIIAKMKPVQLKRRMIANSDIIFVASPEEAEIVAEMYPRMSEFRIRTITSLAPALRVNAESNSMLDPKAKEVTEADLFFALDQQFIPRLFPQAKLLSSQRDRSELRTLQEFAFDDEQEPTLERTAKLVILNGVDPRVEPLSDLSEWTNLFGHRRFQSSSLVTVETLFSQKVNEYNESFRTFQFMDLGTGDGRFILSMKRTLEDMGFDRVEGIGVEARSNYEIPEGVALNHNYFLGDIGQLDQVLPKDTPLQDLIVLNAPELLIHQGFSENENQVSVVDVASWLTHIKKYLADDGLFIIRLYEPLRVKKGEMADWLHLESTVLEQALDTDLDLSYSEVGSTIKGMPFAYTSLGPAIIVKRKSVDRAELRTFDIEDDYEWLIRSNTLKAGFRLLGKQEWNTRLGHRRDAVVSESFDFNDLVRDVLSGKGSDQGLRFTDFATGDGQFVAALTQTLENSGFRNIKGVGVDKRGQDLLEAQLIPGETYFQIDFQNPDEKLHEIEDGSQDFVFMNAPALIKTAIPAGRKIFLSVEDFSPWLNRVKRILSDQGYLVIRLFEDKRNLTDFKADWMKIESYLLEEALERDGGYTWVETKSDVENLPTGSTLLGPVILAQKKSRSELRTGIDPIKRKDGGLSYDAIRAIEKIAATQNNLRKDPPSAEDFRKRRRLEISAQAEAYQLFMEFTGQQQPELKDQLPELVIAPVNYESFQQQHKETTEAVVLSSELSEFHMRLIIERLKGEGLLVLGYEADEEKVLESHYKFLSRLRIEGLLDEFSVGQMLTGQYILIARKSSKRSELRTSFNKSFEEYATILRENSRKKRGNDKERLKRIELLEMIRKQVNPDGNRKLGWYLRSGVDVMNALVATDLDTIIMSDQYEFGKEVSMPDLEDLYVGVWFEDNAINRWATAEVTFNQLFELGANLRAVFELNLAVLDVDYTIEALSDMADGWKIEFEWTHPGTGKTSMRTIYFLGSQKTEDLQNLPKSIKVLIKENEGLDLVIEKAPNYIRQNESERPKGKKSQAYRSILKNLRIANRFKRKWLKLNGLSLGDHESNRYTQGGKLLVNDYPGEFQNVQTWRSYFAQHWKNQSSGEIWGSGIAQFYERVGGEPDGLNKFRRPPLNALSFEKAFQYRKGLGEEDDANFRYVFRKQYQAGLFDLALGLKETSEEVNFHQEAIQALRSGQYDLAIMARLNEAMVLIHDGVEKDQNLRVVTAQAREPLQKIQAYLRDIQQYKIPLQDERLLDIGGLYSLQTLISYFDQVAFLLAENYVSLNPEKEQARKPLVFIRPELTSNDFQQVFDKMGRLDSYEDPDYQKAFQRMYEMGVFDTVLNFNERVIKTDFEGFIDEALRNDEFEKALLARFQQSLNVMRLGFENEINLQVLSDELEYIARFMSEQVSNIELDPEAVDEEVFKDYGGYLALFHYSNYMRHNIFLLSKKYQEARSELRLENSEQESNVDSDYSDHLNKIFQLTSSKAEMKLAWYLNAGADIFSSLYVTDASTLVMSDRLAFGDALATYVEGSRDEAFLQRLASKPTDGEVSLIRLGAEDGFNVRTIIDARLKRKGIQEYTLEKISGSHDLWKIQFAWRHPTASEMQLRTIYYLGKSDSQSLEELPSELLKIINENSGIDVFVEKAPNYDARARAKESGNSSDLDYLPNVDLEIHALLGQVNAFKHRWLKEGGILIGDEEGLYIPANNKLLMSQPGEYINIKPWKMRVSEFLSFSDSSIWGNGTVTLHQRYKRSELRSREDQLLFQSSNNPSLTRTILLEENESGSQMLIPIALGFLELFEELATKGAKADLEGTAVTAVELFFRDQQLKLKTATSAAPILGYDLLMKIISEDVVSSDDETTVKTQSVFFEPLDLQSEIARAAASDQQNYIPYIYDDEYPVLLETKLTENRKDLDNVTAVYVGGLYQDKFLKFEILKKQDGQDVLTPLPVRDVIFQSQVLSRILGADGKPLKMKTSDQVQRFIEHADLSNVIVRADYVEDPRQTRSELRTTFKNYNFSNMTTQEIIDLWHQYADQSMEPFNSYAPQNDAVAFIGPVYSHRESDDGPQKTFDFFLYTVMHPNFTLRRHIAEYFMKDNGGRGLYVPVSMLQEHLSKPWISIDAYGQPLLPEEMSFDINRAMRSKRMALLTVFSELSHSYPTWMDIDNERSRAYLDTIRDALIDDVESQYDAWQENQQQKLKEFVNNVFKEGVSFLENMEPLSLLEVFMGEYLRYFNASQDDPYDWLHQSLDDAIAGLENEKFQRLLVDAQKFLPEQARNELRSQENAEEKARMLEAEKHQHVMAVSPEDLMVTNGMSNQLSQVRQAMQEIALQYNVDATTKERMLRLSHEILYNIIEHGEGAAFAADIVIKNGKMEEIRFTSLDSGRGIEDPNKILEESTKRKITSFVRDIDPRHLGGNGFVNYMSAANNVVIESYGRRWEKVAFNRFEDVGVSDITEGTRLSTVIKTSENVSATHSAFFSERLTFFKLKKLLSLNGWIESGGTDIDWFNNIFMLSDEQYNQERVELFGNPTDASVSGLISREIQLGNFKNLSLEAYQRMIELTVILKGMERNDFPEYTDDYLKNDSEAFIQKWNERYERQNGKPINEEGHLGVQYRDVNMEKGPGSIAEFFSLRDAMRDFLRDEMLELSEDPKLLQEETKKILAVLKERGLITTKIEDALLSSLSTLEETGQLYSRGMMIGLPNRIEIMAEYYEAASLTFRIVPVLIEAIFREAKPTKITSVYDVEEGFEVQKEASLHFDMASGFDYMEREQLGLPEYVDAIQFFKEKPDRVISVFQNALEFNLPLSHKIRRALIHYQPEFEIWLSVERAKGTPSLAFAQVGDRFLKIMESEKPVMRVLWEMYRGGILEALVPELGTVRDIPSNFNIHVFTVGQHTMYNLKKFEDLFDTDEKGLEEGKVIASRLSIAERRQMRLSLLFHDLGKRFFKAPVEADHAIVSSRNIVPVRLKEFGANDAEIKNVMWVVRDHMVLNAFARMRPTDFEVKLPELLRVFALDPEVSVDRLKLLYLISLTDRDSVSPWVQIMDPATLDRLNRIYQELEDYIQTAGEDRPRDIDALQQLAHHRTREDWEEYKMNTSERLRNAMLNLDETAIKGYFDNIAAIEDSPLELDLLERSREIAADENAFDALMEKLFASFSLDKIRDFRMDRTVRRLLFLVHIERQKQLGLSAPVVYFNPYLSRTYERGYEILIGAGSDSDRFFKNITGVLLLHGFDIEEADIRTLATGEVVDKVEGFFHGQYPDEESHQNLKEKISQNMADLFIGNTDSIEILFQEANKPYVSERDTDSLETKVEFQEDQNIYNIRASSFNLKTANRLGLLHAISIILNRRGINLVRAPVSTHPSMINDTFFVNRDGDYLSLSEKSNLVKEIEEVLNQRFIDYADVAQPRHELRTVSYDEYRVPLAEAISAIQYRTSEEDSVDSFEEFFKDPKQLLLLVESYRGRSQRLDSLTSLQSDWNKQALVELVSNAVDWTLAGRGVTPIGRFAVGALQSLGLLEKTGDYVAWTSSVDGLNQYQVKVVMTERGDLDLVLSHQENSDFEQGTAVEIFKDGELWQNYKAFLTKRFGLSTRVPIYFKDETGETILNPLDLSGDREIYLINGSQSEKLAKHFYPSDRIQVNQENSLIGVRDWGMGMDAKVMLTRLIRPRSGNNENPNRSLSTEEIEDRVKVFYEKQGSIDPEEEVESHISLQVAGVEIESVDVTGFNLPNMMAVELPPETNLSTERGSIPMDEMTRNAILVAVNKILNLDEAEKVPLLNAVGALLRKWKTKDEKQYELLMNTVQKRIRDWVEDERFMDSNLIVLPNHINLRDDEKEEGQYFRKDGFQQVDTAGKKIIYLDDVLFPFEAKNISHFTRISNWHSSKGYQLWIVPFKAESDDVYLLHQNYIIVNEKHYRKHADNPAILVQHLNPILDYVPESLMQGRLRGRFILESKSKAKQLVPEVSSSRASEWQVLEGLKKYLVDQGLTWEEANERVEGAHEKTEMIIKENGLDQADLFKEFDPLAGFNHRLGGYGVLLNFLILHPEESQNIDAMAKKVGSLVEQDFFDIYEAGQLLYEYVSNYGPSAYFSKSIDLMHQYESRERSRWEGADTDFYVRSSVAKELASAGYYLHAEYLVNDIFQHIYEPAREGVDFLGDGVDAPEAWDGLYSSTADLTLIGSVRAIMGDERNPLLLHRHKTSDNHWHHYVEIGKTLIEYEKIDEAIQLAKNIKHPSAGMSIYDALLSHFQKTNDQDKIRKLLKDYETFAININDLYETTNFSSGMISYEYFSASIYAEIGSHFRFLSDEQEAQKFEDASFRIFSQLSEEESWGNFYKAIAKGRVLTSEDMDSSYFQSMRKQYAVEALIESGQLDEAEDLLEKMDDQRTRYLKYLEIVEAQVGAVPDVGSLKRILNITFEERSDYNLDFVSLGVLASAMKRFAELNQFNEGFVVVNDYVERLKTRFQFYSREMENIWEPLLESLIQLEDVTNLRLYSSRMQFNYPYLSARAMIAGAKIQAKRGLFEEALAMTIEAEQVSRSILAEKPTEGSVVAREIGKVERQIELGRKQFKSISEIYSEDFSDEQLAMLRDYLDSAFFNQKKYDFQERTNLNLLRMPRELASIDFQMLSPFIVFMDQQMLAFLNQETVQSLQALFSGWSLGQTEDFFRVVNELNPHLVDRDRFNNWVYKWASLFDGIREHDDDGLFRMLLRLSREKSNVFWKEDFKVSDLPLAMQDPALLMVIHYLRADESESLLESESEIDRLRSDNLVNTSSIPALSIAEINAIYNAEAIDEQQTLDLNENWKRVSSLQDYEDYRKTKKRPSEQDLRILNMQINKAIEGQDNSDDISQRELIQNSLKAHSKEGFSGPIKVRGFMRQGVKSEIVTSVEDQAGMDIRDILGPLLVLDERAEITEENISRGFFGIGFFTTFKDFSRVRIMTSKGVNYPLYDLEFWRDAFTGRITVRIDEKVNTAGYKGSIVEGIKEIDPRKNPIAQFIMTNDNLLRYVAAVQDSEIQFNEKPINEALETMGQVETSLGSLKLSIAPSGRQRVTLNGLYVESPDSDLYFAHVPKIYRDIIFRYGLTLELPERLRLTSSRNSIANKEIVLPEIQAAVALAAYQMIVNLFLHKEVYPVGLTQDYLGEEDFYISHEVRIDAEALSRGDFSDVNFSKYTFKGEASENEKAKKNKSVLELLTLIEVVDRLQPNNKTTLNNERLKILGKREGKFSGTSDTARHYAEHGKRLSERKHDFKAYPASRLSEPKLNAFKVLGEVFLEYMNERDIAIVLGESTTLDAPAFFSPDLQTISYDLADASISSNVRAFFDIVSGAEYSKADLYSFFEDYSSTHFHETAHRYAHSHEREKLEGLFGWHKDRLLKRFLLSDASLEEIVREVKKRMPEISFTDTQNEDRSELRTTDSDHHLDFERIERDLRVVAADESTPIDISQVGEIMNKLRSGEIANPPYRADVDIIKILADGSEEVIGPLRPDIAETYSLLHRTSAVFIKLPDGKYLFDQRAPGYYGLYLSINGGHVDAGRNYRETIIEEIREELGFPIDWTPENELILIDREGAFDSPSSVDPLNNEKRSQYIYTLSEAEHLMWQATRDELERVKSTKSQEEFIQWLRSERSTESKFGETFNYVVLDLKEVLAMVNEGKPIKLINVFRDERLETDAVLTPDLLEPMLKDARVLTALERSELRTVEESESPIILSFEAAKAMRDQSTSLNSIGFVGRGIQFLTEEMYLQIRKKGLLAPNDRDDQSGGIPSKFPSKVSLSLSRDRFFRASSIDNYGVGLRSDNSDVNHVTFVLDQNYIREHRDDFELVGRLLNQNEAFRDDYQQGLESLGLSDKQVYLETNVAFPDEIHANFVPTEAFSGIVVTELFASKIREWDLKHGLKQLPLYLAPTERFQNELKRWSPQQGADIQLKRAELRSPNVSREVTVGDILFHADLKYESKKLAEGYDGVEQAGLIGLFPDDVSYDPRTSLRTTYAKYLVDDRDVISFDLIAQRIESGELDGEFVFKPNAGSTGLGIFFIEKRKDQWVLTMARDLNRSNPVYTLMNIFPNHKQLDQQNMVEFYYPVSDDGFSEFLIDFRQKLVRFGGARVDAGLLERVVPGMKYRGQAFETRHRFKANLETIDVELKNLDADINERSFARVAPGRFSNISNQRSDDVQKIFFPNMYDPIFEVFDIAEGRREAFIAYVNENVQGLLHHMLRRLNAVGATGDVDIQGHLDFFWLPPNPEKTGHEFPVMVFNESQILNTESLATLSSMDQEARRVVNAASFAEIDRSELRTMVNTETRLPWYAEKSFRLFHSELLAIYRAATMSRPAILALLKQLLGREVFAEGFSEDLDEVFKGMEFSQNQQADLGIIYDALYRALQDETTFSEKRGIIDYRQFDDSELRSGLENIAYELSLQLEVAALATLQDKNLEYQVWLPEVLIPFVRDHLKAMLVKQHGVEDYPDNLMIVAYPQKMNQAVDDMIRRLNKRVAFVGEDEDIMDYRPHLLRGTSEGDLESQAMVALLLGQELLKEALEFSDYMRVFRGSDLFDKWTDLMTALQSRIAIMTSA